MAEHTDRELLDLAAKAAGIEAFYPFGKDAIYVRWMGPYAFRDTSDDDGALKIWNPLASDGDALRLAVKLRLGIDYTDCICCVTVYGAEDDEGDNIKERIAFQGEHIQAADAATRRAIVRAAAEVGEAHG